jgi:hypothetical protein
MKRWMSFECWKEWGHEIVHNCLIHPILPFIGRDWAIWLHTKHAKWAFGDEELR